MSDHEQVSRRTYQNHSYRASDILQRNRFAGVVRKRTELSSAAERFEKGKRKWQTSQEFKERQAKLARFANGMPVHVEDMGYGHVVRVEQKTGSVFVTFGRGEMKFPVDRVHKSGEVKK